MSHYDAIIVGGGITGCTIARALAAEGRRTLVVDDGRPEAGTRASAGLLKPSWFDGLGKAVYEPALQMLERLYPIQTLRFSVWPTRIETQVFHVPRERDLPDPYEGMSAKVRAVGSGWAELALGTRLEAPLIVVATGSWASELLPVEGLHGKMGVAFRWPGKVENMIRPWAPYKQIVAFNELPGWAWGGDGSAIKPDNWTDERERQSRDRVARGLGGVPSSMIGNFSAYRGIRPFVDGAKPLLLEQREPGLWVATGGGKNGTLAAGFAAHKIVEATS